MRNLTLRILITSENQTPTLHVRRGYRGIFRERTFSCFYQHHNKIIKIKRLHTFLKEILRKKKNIYFLSVCWGGGAWFVSPTVPVYGFAVIHVGWMRFDAFHGAQMKIDLFYRIICTPTVFLVSKSNAFFMSTRFSAERRPRERSASRPLRSRSRNRTVFMNPLPLHSYGRVGSDLSRTVLGGTVGTAIWTLTNPLPTQLLFRNVLTFFRRNSLARYCLRRSPRTVPTTHRRISNRIRSLK